MRQIAAEAGTTRLAVRVRPTNDVHRIVVAFPWRNRTPRAGPRPGGRRGARRAALARTSRSWCQHAAAGGPRAPSPVPGPTTLRPRVPIVAVTGTNGKTTTSRMVAHIARTHGLHVGWSSTDGIYVDGELVEPGRLLRPLAAPAGCWPTRQVQLAVTETARGGILLKGIGLTHNDVSVFTNVSADHLGLHGIDTLDQLAEVKGVVPRITKPGGWAVLNADDPRVYATRTSIKAKPWVFSRDPDSPAIRETLSDGGRATTVIDGWISVLTPGLATPTRWSRSWTSR